jgi:VWFA-related protein
MLAPLAVLALLAHAGAVQPAVARAVVPPFLGQAEGSSQAGEAGPSTPRDDVPAPVFVDVIATDSRGRSVDTLTQEDFELREDGTPQSIDAVRFVKKANPSGAVEPGPTIESDSDERAAAAVSNTRLFAFFLDEYHVTAASAARARSALLRFIDENIDPSDLIVVMRPLDSLMTIRMTRDRGRIRQEIEAFEGRQGDHTPKNATEQSYMAGTPERIEQLRAQVATSALNAMAVHLGSLGQQGRKTLVVVTEGLPKLERRRGFESLPTVDGVIRSANRVNVAIYVVDPRQPPIDSAATAGADILQSLAASTSGRYIAHADLQVGMRPIAADSSGYYLLSYRPGRVGDNAFHEVAVGVKKSGIALRLRNGYWAAASEESLRAYLAVPRRSPPLEPPRRISTLIRPWFGVSRGTEGRTRVTFVWEPTSRVPGTRIKSPSASRVLLKAFAADGASLYDGTVLPSGPVRPDSSADARAVFEVPPGTVRLRMSIEDQAAQPIDTDVRDLSVRDLSGPVVLGTAAFMRARTAVDYRALENDPDAAPVASREFSRTERLMIRVPAYAPSGVPLTVSARLLNRGGQAIRDLPVEKGTVVGAPNQIDLLLASLATGQYFVEVIAKSPAGEVKDLIEFRVTS